MIAWFFKSMFDSQELKSQLLPAAKYITSNPDHFRQIMGFRSACGHSIRPSYTSWEDVHPWSGQVTLRQNPLSVLRHVYHGFRVDAMESAPVISRSGQSPDYTEHSCIHPGRVQCAHK